MRNAKAASKYTRLLMRCTVVLLLCLSSVVGVSYALFTSNVEDGTIGINVTSGRVDVDIVNEDGETLVGSVLKLLPTGQELNDFRFEPGATVVTEGFKVANVGDVPVNFRMYISRDAAVDEAKFAEAFEIYVTKTSDNLENAEKIMMFEGKLSANKTTDVYYLVIRMKETAGNDFQNVSYRGIGITVYAVQGNVSVDQIQS